MFYIITFTLFSFGLGKAYSIVFKASLVISFCVVSVCLLSITCIILIYKSLLITTFSKINDYNDFFESIFSFGLGAMVVSIIARMAGGYYSKAADIANYLIAKKNKVENNNSLDIHDKIGDIVGGIAGVATDAFGTMSLAICSTLYLASTSEELINTGGYFFPLLITASGIFVCIVSTSVALLFGVNSIMTRKSLFNVIILQMFFSIFLLIPFIYLISFNFLPIKYNVGRSGSFNYKEEIDQSDTMMCPLIGLMSGICISLISCYYTSNSNKPVSQVLEATKQGSTISIILGLSLGYISCLVPTIIIAGSVFFSYYLLDIFGISLCALGMLSTLPVYIAIETSSIIADNSRDLALSCGIYHVPIVNLKKIEKTCNTLGKGYLIGCSCMVALSLLGVYIIISKIDDINVNSPLIFAGLLFGAMKPYYFAAVVLKQLGMTSIELIKANAPNKENLSPEEKQQINNDILLNNSVKKIFIQSFLIIMLPIKIGILFGIKAISGMLLGIIISGIQLGISNYISGIAWKNCKSLIEERGISVTIYEKKQIELAQLQNSFEKEKAKENPRIRQEDIETKQKEINNIENTVDHFDRKAKIHVKDSEDKFYKKCLKSSSVGDTIGDALKDMSGPFLMVIIKLLPAICIVSCHYFINTSYLIQD